jgi:hypothetical protein
MELPMSFPPVLRTTVSAFVLAIVCLGLVSTSSAQDQKFVMTLEDELVTKFKTFGSLVSIVREDARGKIGTIEVQFNETEERAAVPTNIAVSIRDGEAMVVLDNAMVERIKSQPIQINITSSEKNFSKVLLVYDAPAREEFVPEVKDSDGNPMEIVFVKLDDMDNMAGGIEALTKVEMKTSFGNVTIPMEQLAGLRLHLDEDDTAIAVLTNGDSVTGIPALPEIKLITDWGQADIETKHIRSLTMTPGSRFRQESSDFGPRWILDTGNSLAPGAPAGR